MDKPIVAIDDFTHYHWFERAAKHTNFNRYTLYKLHAHHNYRALTSAEKIKFILRIPGLAGDDDNVDDFNYSASKEFVCHPQYHNEN
jgi:hypothetical protein